jgi:bifunctional non-homologous end joining protein LigD
MPARAPPAFRPVQLATLVDAVPTDRDWLNELKYDDYRIALSVVGDDVRAFICSGLD